MQPLHALANIVSIGGSLERAELISSDCPQGRQVILDVGEQVVRRRYFGATAVDFKGALLCGGYIVFCNNYFQPFTYNLC